MKDYNLMETVTPVRAFIAKGKTSEAIKELLEITKSMPSLHNQATLLSSKLESINTENLEGVIARNDYDQNLSKINKSVLEICSKIESGYSDKSPNKSPKRIFLYSLLGILVVSLIAFALASINTNNESTTKLTVISEQAFQLTENVLKKNQKKLSVIYKEEANITQLIDNAADLYNFQEYKGHFAKIKTQLSTIIPTLQDSSRIKINAEKLLSTLEELNDLLYGVPNEYIGLNDHYSQKIWIELKRSQMNIDSLVESHFFKASMINVINRLHYYGDKKNKVNLIRIITNSYLMQLREISKEVGEVHGYFLTLD